MSRQRCDDTMPARAAHPPEAVAMTTSSQTAVPPVPEPTTDAGTTQAGNAATVAAIYAAFARGDVPAVLDRLADDVAWEEWADNSAQRAGLADLAPRHGRDEVAGFFDVIGAW